MGRATESLLCLAAVASCWLLVLPALGFVVGRQVAGPATGIEQRFLGVQSPAAPEESGSASATFAAGLGLGLVAVGLAAARRQAAARTARQSGPTGAIQEIKGPFAGGLVGSEEHGWGRYEWDPLELSQRYPEHLAWYRESELKHGRIAMLAFLGLLAPDAFRLPLSDFEAPDLDFVNAHNKLIYGLGLGPMWWLLVACSVIESLRFKQMGLGFEKLTLQNAGDLDFGKGFLPKTAEGVASIKVKELKNGRLAMLAVSGILTSGVLWNAHHFPFLP